MGTLVRTIRDEIRRVRAGVMLYHKNFWILHVVHKTVVALVVGPGQIVGHHHAMASKLPLAHHHLTNEEFSKFGSWNFVRVVVGVTGLLREVCACIVRVVKWLFWVGIRIVRLTVDLKRLVRGRLGSDLGVGDCLRNAIEARACAVYGA